MDKKRTALLGSLFGIINILLSAVGGIVVRKFFVESLGTEYLGLTAVFSSILGILLSMDGGVAGSLLYKIYKPISDGDEKEIARTFKLIKTMYLFRAGIIAVIGIIAIVLLPQLCKSTSIDMGYVYKAYMIYLVLTSFSYYIILYSFLLEAFQKRYIVSIVSSLTYLLSIVLQITLLISIKSYLIYLVISIMQPIILYLICRIEVFRKYPYVSTKQRLSKNDWADVPQYLKMAIHTLGTVIASYTDAFLITAFTGLATLGLYDNYKIISTKVSALFDQITSSIKDPMRLLIAEGNKDRVEETLYNINFLIFVIAGLGSLMYLALITPFVKIWLGNDYVLSYAIAGASAFTMFLAALNYITVDTYYYVGCFKTDKQSPIIEIIVNLGISFILGRWIGISGVLIGTVFYYFVQEYLRTRKLYKDFFGTHERGYLQKYFKYAFIQLILILGTIYIQWRISGLVPLLAEMILYFFIVVTIFGLCVYVLFRKTSSYEYVCKTVFGYLSRILKRKIIGGDTV